MGTLNYGSGTTVEFSDDVLTHLRTVIITKFVQDESFIFTWVDTGQQRSLWLHPNQLLSFVFSQPEVPPIRRDVINELMNLANSPGGLRIPNGLFSD